MKHMRAFHTNDKQALTKAKELRLHGFLKDAGVNFEYQRHIPFQKCGLGSETQCAFLDFLIARPWGYIVLECDENQHRERDPNCDVRRDFDIAASVALGSGQPLMVVRFNPDAYEIGGLKQHDPWPQRCKRLLAFVEGAQAPVGFERVFVCYDRGVDEALPAVAKHWQNSVAREVSRCLVDEAVRS